MYRVYRRASKVKAASALDGVGRQSLPPARSRITSRSLHTVAQQTAQQDLVDPTAKSLDAVDDHHRHALVVPLSQIGLSVDIDLAGR